MALNVPGGSITLAFAMKATGNAQLIWFDAGGGSGTVASGDIERANPSAYNASKINGDYAFGFAGFDSSHSRAAFLGRLTANGAGSFSNGAADIYAYGNTNPVIIAVGSYVISDTVQGRGSITLACLIGGVPHNFNFVLYVVNKGELFVMETDPIAGTTALLNGRVLQQQTTVGGFSNASLHGNMVLYVTAYTPCGSAPTPSAAVILGLLAADGTSALNITFDQNCGGTDDSVTGLSGTYLVAGNGRAMMTIGPFNTIAYLVNTNQAFLLGTDSSGFIEPQAPMPLNNSSLIGNYAGLAIDLADSNVNVFSGEFTADGSGPTGDFTGTEDLGTANNPTPNSSFAATYSISSSPTNGRGTMTIASGSGGSAVAYVASPSEVFALPLGDPNPAVWTFALLAPPSLSSLTLNPTSVVGGVQTSTGTVTLTGPAPAGGVQILLSSGNPAAVTLPSSVTIPAGATSATFTVNTSIVLVSTSVHITATYNGTTKTATLDVLL